ncbi:hypothetical protein C8J57DRAFT_1279813 [Mycena rebaudengoi]|nr:hypothetical protein C8J57DRAFT_1279813 [Mycena rebaudengoi]
MHLPEELICQILGKLYYKSPPLSEPDYHTLSACALVNSLWTMPAQTLLLRHITSARAHTFSVAAATVLSSTLLSHVRIFSVALSQTTVGDSPLVKTCRLSWSLSLGAATADLSSAIRSNPTTIRSLKLMECSVQSPILYELLALLPDVQFLTLGVEIAASPPAWTPKFHLYELSLHRTLPSEVLLWLLADSETSLRILELRDLPSANGALDLAKHCPHLHSLRLMRYSTHTATILRLCTNLLELVLLNVPMLVSLPKLSPSLEHLAFAIQTHSASVDLQPVITAVDSLPHLRILSCFGVSEYSRLKEVCDAKGIIMWASSQKFWVNDDPIVTTRFPRRRQSVSNFYLMS